jgi:hypothetical protein
MSLRKPNYRIRKYRAEEGSRVRTICHDTGYMGSSASFSYRDVESFADMFSGYYTDCEPEHAWVVERTTDGLVVGYLLGCIDSRRAWNPTLVAARHIVLRGILFRPGTAGFYGRVIADMIRDRGVHRPKMDFDRYPAHYHINLLPEARGYASGMYYAWIARLRSVAAPGLHGEMIAENKPALAIGERLGYRRHGNPYPLPGFRDPEGRRLHGQLMILDLTRKRARVSPKREVRAELIAQGGAP